MKSSNDIIRDAMESKQGDFDRDQLWDDISNSLDQHLDADKHPGKVTGSTNFLNSAWVHIIYNKFFISLTLVGALSLTLYLILNSQNVITKSKTDSLDTMIQTRSQVEPDRTETSVKNNQPEDNYVSKPFSTVSEKSSLSYALAIPDNSLADKSDLRRNSESKVIAERLNFNTTQISRKEPRRKEANNSIRVYATLGDTRPQPLSNIQEVSGTVSNKNEMPNTLSSSEINDPPILDSGTFYTEPFIKNTNLETIIDRTKKVQNQVEALNPEKVNSRMSGNDIRYISPLSLAPLEKRTSTHEEQVNAIINKKKAINPVENIINDKMEFVPSIGLRIPFNNGSNTLSVQDLNIQNGYQLELSNPTAEFGADIYYRVNSLFTFSAGAYFQRQKYVGGIISNSISLVDNTLAPYEESFSAFTSNIGIPLQMIYHFDVNKAIIPFIGIGTQINLNQSNFVIAYSWGERGYNFLSKSKTSNKFSLHIEPGVSVRLGKQKFSLTGVFQLSPQIDYQVTKLYESSSLEVDQIVNRRFLGMRLKHHIGRKAHKI